MTEYQIIDAICDLVNPLVWLLAISLAIHSMIRKNYRRAGISLGLLAFGLSLTYGLMWLDIQWQIWPSFGADYSTHTAFLIACLVAIHCQQPRTITLLLTYCGYMLTMHYQQYHSLLDIVTTTLVISGILLPIYRHFFKHIPLNDQA